jgi:hypothetical protein
MSMVEKAARAFFEQIEAEKAYSDRHWPEVLIDGYFNIEAAMRAAIAAMRYPTVEMVEKADNQFPSGYTLYIWETMIEAALKEPEARPVAQEQQSDLPTPR